MAYNVVPIGAVANMRAVHVRFGKIDNVKQIMNLPLNSNCAYWRLAVVKIMENLFVIKDKNDAFVEQNSMNSKELNYCFKSIESAQKYTQSEIDILKERFKGTWREKGFKVYKVLFTLLRV